MFVLVPQPIQYSKRIRVIVWLYHKNDKIPNIFMTQLKSNEPSEPATIKYYNDANVIMLFSMIALLQLLSLLHHYVITICIFFKIFREKWGEIEKRKNWKLFPRRKTTRWDGDDDYHHQWLLTLFWFDY